MNQISSKIKELSNKTLESDFIQLRDEIVDSRRISKFKFSEHYEEPRQQTKEPYQQIKVMNQQINEPHQQTNETHQQINEASKINVEQIDLKSVYKNFNQMYKIGKYDEILTEFQNLFAQNGTLHGRPIPKLLLSILTKSIIKTVHQTKFFFKAIFD